MQHDIMLSIKALVGESVTQEHLVFVDCFVHDWFAIFLPVGGNCGYAVTPKHTHPSYMFVLPYDSESVVYVGKKRIETEPQSILCLSPEVSHHEEQHYLPPKYCAVCIEKRHFENVFHLYSKDMPKFQGEVFTLQNSKLDMLVKEFIFESQNTHASKKLLLENFSALLTHEITRTILGHTTNDFHILQNQRINEAVKFINAHYEKEISLEEMARSAALSKSRFAKLFTQTMKISPIQYLHHIRLQNAKKMLLSGRLNITQVSVRCGFNSPSYFAKSFKSVFHETPKEFLRRGK